MDSTNSSRGGISLLGALGIVFIVLKLVGTIDWSWWWVLAPFWAPIVVGLVLSLLFAVIGGLVGSGRRR